MTEILNGRAACDLFVFKDDARVNPFSCLSTLLASVALLVGSHAAEPNPVDTFPDKRADWAEATPKPTTKGAPGAYPAYAELSGSEGSTTVGFVIDDEGKPQDFRILASAPRGVFEAACLNYLVSFKYQPQTYKGETEPRERTWSYACRYKLGP